MKLHIGNGTIYLDGWVNVDNESPTTFLPDKRPDLVEKWRTTEDAYYAKHPNTSESSTLAPSHHETVCDAYGDLCSLPYGNGVADEILCRQVFEHLSIREARQALSECNRVLKIGGTLRVDVPDHVTSMEEYRKTGRHFFWRHIFGSQKCDSAWHVMGWCKESLQSFASQHGLILDRIEENIHFYPAFCLRFKKVQEWESAWRHAAWCRDLSRPWKAAWEYCGDWWDRTPGRPLKVPREWSTLEVGPGRNPWPGAYSFVEPNQEFSEALSPQARIGTVERLPETHPPHHYDFVYISHVLEHVPNPADAINGLEYVAKRGLIVCPSPMIDTLYAFHEADHKWWVQNRGGELVFQKVPDYVKQLSVLDMQKAAHRFWRLGSPNLGLDGIHARKWYHIAEPFLTTYLWWEGSIPFKVIP